MSALAFTPWFVLSVKILTGAFIALLGGKLYAVLRRESGQQRQDLAAKIELLLPQTQCGQCGYEGCAPYAQALANGDAINKCPPGGTRTIASLARLLHKPSVPLDPAHGSISAPTRAWIREAECIGCTKCIQACPVDAIIGAARLMHTIIASECTGCDLCVGPCPVDCIDMLPVTDPGAPHWYFPASSRPVMLTSTGSARL